MGRLWDNRSFFLLLLPEAVGENTSESLIAQRSGNIVGHYNKQEIAS
jgi:hypothetical protein